MINFPNNFLHFLFTPNMDVEKSLLLKTADFCLDPFIEIMTPFNELGIGGGGFPRNIMGYDDMTGICKNPKRYFLYRYSPMPLVALCPPLLKKIICPFYLNSYFLGISTGVFIAKKIKDFAWVKIDQQGPFLGSRLLKGVALAMSVSIPIIFGYGGLNYLAQSMNLSLSVISLIALTYLPIKIVAGALLKLVAYNIDPKFKSAYHRYCEAKEVNNPTQLLPQSKIEDPSNSNTKMRAVCINQENLGEFSRLSSDIFEFFLCSYLSSQNLIKFRSVRNNFYVDISNDFILTRRIKENFSIDFINKLGLSYILKAMKDSPLDPYLKPRTSGDCLSTRETEDQYINIASSFEINIKNKSITWGHVSVESPKNESKLFLIFNLIKNNSFTELNQWGISPEKYYMISAHENSKISWEQRAINTINYGRDHFAYPIYKVDEDYYSNKPIFELQEEDYQDDNIVIKTDFFKCLSNPETFADI